MVEKHYETIKQKFNDESIETFEHDKIHSAEEAAEMRGISLSQNVKSIVLRLKGGEEDYAVFALQGGKKIDFEKVETYLGVDDCFLADPGDVKEVTGCKVGTVPPFGSVLGLKTYLDESVVEEEEIYFSAGTHHRSIKTDPDTFLRVEDPLTFSFSKVVTKQ